MTSNDYAHAKTNGIGRWVGLAVVVLGIGVAAVGPAVLPQLLVWLLAAMLAWVGVTMWMRSDAPGKRAVWLRSSDGPRRVEGLKPGERYETAVKLTQVPNVPLAEMICSRLRANGIEAFYKGISPYAAAGGLAPTDPAFPAEIWVGAGHVEQARQLLP
ncbi:MAG: DUF2007 domain-containing protein [Gaiellaceae bacterium]